MSDVPQIPDLDLLRPIGRGGFGEVWIGVNRTTGALRAVKLIPLHGVAADPAGREVVSLAQLESQRGARHPNLLDIQHVGRTADHLFYLMDPADDVSGAPASTATDYRPATLARRLEQGPLSTDECWRCAQQLLSGLAHLHQAGMVHRDVKPANCLFVGRELKLADFGLLTTTAAHLSRLGTLKYMPPDGRMDLRADVYAAGLVIYEMLTGLPADAFPQLGERARHIAADPLLARLNRLALQAAQRDRHQRFAHAGLMLADLERPPVQTRAETTRRVAAGLLGLGLLGGLIAYAAWPDGPTPRELSNSKRPPGNASPTFVPVNFVTDTFDAEIYLDGQRLVDQDGQPLKTPCTAPAVSAMRHRVRFVHPTSGEYDAGTIDFSQVREVVVSW
ncbi:MAG: serine/threonine-protein kinase [Pirellulales bacterium]